MAIDWNAYDPERLAKEATNETDSQLASKISSITRMKDEEVIKLFPKSADAIKVAELIRIVRSSDNRNKKIKQLVGSAETFAGVTLTLLEKFI